MGSPQAQLLLYGMSFEKLRVYLAAEQLAVDIQALIETIPASQQHRVRNLGRCAASMPANIAEAYGVGRSDREATQGRKIMHLEIARGSGDETRAELRRLTREGLLPEKRSVPFMITARAVSKMLTSLIATLL